MTTRVVCDIAYDKSINLYLLDSSCNVMAHDDAREGSEGETGEWSG